MRWRLSILGLLVISLGWGWVFIFSDPLGADVFMNEKPIGQTPLALTNTPSSFTLALAKPGYRGIRTQIRITSRLTNLSYVLTSESFSVSFPGYEQVMLENKIMPASEIANLATGTYAFQIESNILSVHRINPYKPLLFFSLGVMATGLVAGTTGLILGSLEYDAFKKATTYEEAVTHMEASMFYDNLALWGYSLGLAGGGISFGLYLQDREFTKRSDQFVSRKVGYFGGDKKLYDEAMDFISQEKPDIALQRFENLLIRYPDSTFIPPALYQWGKILRSRGEDTKAEEIFSRLLTSYPTLDFYELTLYELFTLDLARSQFVQAEKRLMILRSIQFFYSVEDTDWFEIELYRQWAKKSPAKYPLYQSRKEAFIQTRTYSPERRQQLQQETN